MSQHPTRRRRAGLQEAVPCFDASGCAVAARELRSRAVRHGLQALDEMETLQLLVARAAPRRAAALAERLMVRFGGLAHVLGASLPELLQVVDESVALELKLLQDATRRVLEFPMRRRSILSSWSAVADYLRISLSGQSRESFRVLFLDRRNGLIADELMGAGTVDHAPVYPREVARRALELAASSCCLAHNHPSGDPSPSKADVEMTRQVVEACRTLGLAVHDHFLVAGDQVVSFRAAGLM
ncbi:DNA repair protein RadC [Phenylobacterium sp. LjRoot219]|uniref:RadC family protein n=1 Tax=Phenylobacterium sp. LjRoot219 TaxID=3342283 RepID=UPI003ECCA0C7